MDKYIIQCFISVSFKTKQKVSNPRRVSHPMTANSTLQGSSPGSQEAHSHPSKAERGLCCWHSWGGGTCWHCMGQALATCRGCGSHRVWPRGLGWTHLHTACLPPCSLACRDICRTWACSGRWHQCGSHLCPLSTRPRQLPLCGERKQLVRCGPGSRQQLCGQGAPSAACPSIDHGGN